MLTNLPRVCPSCSSQLNVTSLCCPSCITEIRGEFELPPLARLDSTDQQFIIDFVKSSGSLKLMAEKMKLSYPTVRNLLDDIIARLKVTSKNLPLTPSPLGEGQPAPIARGGEAQNNGFLEVPLNETEKPLKSSE